MAQDIETLVAQLSADIRGYERGMRKAQLETRTAMQRIEQRTGRMTQTVGRQFQSMSRLAVGALGAIGVALSARAFTNFITGTMQAAESISDMANQANAAIGELQVLRLFADQNGSSAASLDRALRRLSSTAGDVLAGRTDRATRAIERLGLAQRITTGEIQTSDAIFAAIVERMEAIEDANTQAALAVDLFGQRLGAELVQALRRGSGALDEFRRDAIASGAVLDEEMVTRAASANAQLRELSNTIKTNLQSAILESIPAIEAVMETISGMIPTLAEWSRGVAELFAQFGGPGLSGADPQQAAAILRYQAGRAAAGEFPDLRRGTWDGADAEIQRALGREGLDEVVRDLREIRKQFETVSAGPEGTVIRRLDENAFNQAVADYLARRADQIVLDARAREMNRPDFSTPAGGGGSGGGLPSLGAGSQGPEAAPHLPRPIPVGFGIPWHSPMPSDSGLPVVDVDAEETAKELAEALERERASFQRTFRHAFQDGFLALLDGNAKEALSAWWRSAITSALGSALDTMAGVIFDTFKKSAGGGSGGIGGTIASVFGFGGHRANGGPVRPGTAYRVGERGPETFVPTSAGYIQPNVPDIRARAPVHVHNHFAFHAEGAVLTDQLLQQMQQIGTVSGQLAVERARQVIPADLARSARHRFNR